MDARLQQIAANHGVWHRYEARDLGYHEMTMQHLIDAREWHRVRWGTYTYRETWDRLDARERYGVLCRAALRRSQTDVALSHLSSANEWGAPLWDVDLSHVDLTRKDGRTGRRAAGIIQHRGRLIEGDWVERNGVAVMSATRTALELTTVLDVQHSLVEIEELIHQGHTTIEALVSRYEEMNHWPDSLHTGLILGLLTGRSESVGETRAFHLCWAQALPRPIANYEIRDADGRVLFRVDLAWPELGVFLEFDGKEKYVRHRREGESIADCIERERQRENLIRELTGWRCIRIVWADLYVPARTAARIRALLDAAA